MHSRTAGNAVEAYVLLNGSTVGGFASVLTAKDTQAGRLSGLADGSSKSGQLRPWLKLALNPGKALPLKPMTLIPAALAAGGRTER